MVAAVAVGTYKSVDAGLLHLVNHMLYKALLFMSAGSLIYSTGTGNVHDLLHQGEEGGGARQPVWKALPVAAIGAVVGALAIAGTPLFNGYVSKYLLKKAMYHGGLPETMLLVAGVGTSISFCKFVYFGFIKPRVVLRPAPKA
jgi:multicomponent Na+:H+ antiporter subunit D